MAASRAEVTPGSVRRHDVATHPLRRAWPSVAAVLVVVGMLVLVAWDAGGYFPTSYLTVGMVAFAALGLLLAIQAPHYRLSTPALVGVISLTGIVMWTALSTRWSTAADTGLEVMQRDLAYLGLFGLGLVAAGSGRYARHLIWLVLGGMTVVVGAGVISRLYPELIGPGAMGGTGTWTYRLDYPLTYWNAYGGLAAIGVALAVGMAADLRSNVILRGLASAAAVVMAVGLYLSFSRGAWFSLIAGLAGLVALGPRRIWLLVSALPVIVGAAMVILRLQTFHELVDRPSAIGVQAAAGRQVVVVLVLAVVGAGLVQAVLPRLRPSEDGIAVLSRAVRAVLLPAVIGVVLLLAAVVTIGSTGAETRVNGFLTRQWQDFVNAQATPGSGNQRLLTTKGTRVAVYNVAIDEFKRHPFGGGGAGSFEYAWLKHRTTDENVRNAHSLYLETLAETGIVGALLLVAFLGSLIAALVRSRQGARALSRPHASAVGAALVVYLIHAAGDWDWQMTSLTGFVLVLAAALYPEGRRRLGSSARRRGRYGIRPAAGGYDAMAR